MDAEKFLSLSKQRVESFFLTYFENFGPWASESPGGQATVFSDGLKFTKDAMLYSLEAGGKRLRPALVYGALEALGRDLNLGDPAAAAVEMIHTYSLIHDDLPCMDDDNFRRGRPTCHVKFGEAQALLAGDGLLTEAMTLLSHPKTVSVWGPMTAMQVAYELSVGAGYRGMVGGQAMDLLCEGQKIDQTTLEGIHRCKTGALIRASVRMGALIGGATEAQLSALDEFSRTLGLSFQVADDVLDVTADSATLGKTAGKDLESQKATYPSLMGLEPARSYAQSLSERAVRALDSFGLKGDTLRSLARFTVSRQS